VYESSNPPPAINGPGPSKMAKQSKFLDGPFYFKTGVYNRRKGHTLKTKGVLPNLERFRTKDSASQK
jgi:hypothetical protein